MTQCAKLFLILVTLGVAFTSPICVENCENQTDDIESIKEVRDVSNDLRKSDDCSREDAKCSSSSSEEESKERVESENELGLRYLQPRILTSVPYQGNQNAEDLGVDVSSYNGVLYPHAHPKLLATYNSGFNVNALPPVLSTYIHGLVPQEEIQRAAYDLDVLSPEETAYLPGLARPSRMLRTADDDWLDQLKHDAMMNNILPTMSVPFARYAAPAPAYVPASVGSIPASYGGVSAVFPYASPGGCAQPILFSCTPRIIRGTLKPIGSYGSAAPTYRQPVDKTVKVNDKHSDPVKVDLVGKTVAATDVKQGH